MSLDKLKPEDEGTLQIAIAQDGDCVILDFGKEVKWIGMPPQIAVGLAEALIQRAQEIAKAKGEVLTLSVGRSVKLNVGA